MGRKSAVKGRNGEEELQEIFRQHGFDLLRGGTRSFGARPDLYGLPFVHIEVKRCEKVSMPRWLEQAKRDALKFGDGCPVVFFRQNRQPWFVTMNLEAWLKLYDAYYKRKN